MGWKGFVEGGLASIVAGSATHPLDLIKVRMQLQGEAAAPAPALASASGSSFSTSYGTGTISMGRQVVRAEGVKALYSGVSASILRQVLYSSTRLGLYEVLKVQMQDEHEKSLPLHKKIAAGLAAGGVGAAVGCPADVALVRMQADGRLPTFQRRNYKGVADALVRIVRQEGIGSLWTGSGATVQRAMIVTASQLATYDQIKDFLISKHALQDGLSTHIAASVSAGFVTSVASNPIDVIKTRIMNMEVQPGQTPPYSGAIDCAIKTIKKEGPMALYKGFIPTVSRQGPFAVVLFVTLEQVKKLLKDF
ncbi:solute carrier family 25 (mitochondrial oxoglutarate transporter), member 11 [Marchantia polymorpha subsp. ruderalis]|nr:hypothetical protein MARPO_0198s0014 [Marchantia polymorpha]BBN10961.1 hypothetical protein Mp_5g07950 [Marchantia polymorpha subsp. ruderalis]|eukprot:PTQ27446.1 hypothetical protein MARPO_0198s0014 [Marchantia polymorpha]